LLKVSLLSYTQEAEKVVASAAKLCYSSCSIEEIGEKLTDDGTGKFINMLSKIGHESPIEHANFTFGIEGISRALLAQLTRHRIASYSVQSQRYIKENCFEYVTPPEIENLSEAKEEFLSAMEKAQQSYDNLVKILMDKHKKEFISLGMEETVAEKKAEKRAIEDARFVLPNACETKLICTFNARSLLNFFSLRCCMRAQWEIRALAKEMLKLVSKIAPNIFVNAGPACIRGNCKEGKMSCGRYNEVRKEFEEIKRGS
jgi:thymidylate synthase, flavin-dependent